MTPNETDQGCPLLPQDFPEGGSVPIIQGRYTSIQESHACKHALKVCCSGVPPLPVIGPMNNQFLGNGQDQSQRGDRYDRLQCDRTPPAGTLRHVNSES